MTLYREHRPRASEVDGAALVRFQATVNIEFKADLAMNAVVGFETDSTGLRGE